MRNLDKFENSIKIHFLFAKLMQISIIFLEGLEEKAPIDLMFYTHLPVI